MFGPKVKISNNNISMTLGGSPTKEDIPEITNGMSDWQVLKYLGRSFGTTKKEEREWMEKTSKSDSVIWLIRKGGKLIGSTGLHHLDSWDGSCTSGCVIWDKSQWGNGIASLAHVVRTWFAAKQYNRHTIGSSVYVPNVASYKALEKVGYIRVGKELRVRFIDGAYVDKYIYTWLNPIYINTLYPNGVPTEYEDAVAKAKETLDKGDKLIQYV
jgi:RimJ/RimL family protein N-acetyltransferase